MINNSIELNSYTSRMVKDDFKKADKYVLKLLFAHWFLATFIISIEFNTSMFGFIIGGLIFVAVYLTYIFSNNSALFRNISAIALVSYSALFIQQYMGRLEFHFHIFVVLSFLTIYKDRLPMVSASIFVILHHLLFNYLQENNIFIFNQPVMIFNYGCGIDIVLLHAVFVIFEAVVLYHIIGTKIEEFKKVVESEFKMMHLNQILEDKIAKRTKELKDAKEEADRANSLKSQFLANMSHEIRTPMNAVIGFTDILKDREKDELNKQYISSIQTSAHSLLDIINDILDISKIEAGKLTIQKGVVNPYVFCNDIMSIFKFKAKEKNIELILNIDNSIPKALIFDEVRVRQILINLIGNALKFTNIGFVKVKLSKESLLSDPSILKLIFAIEDSGAGIEKENLESIFESFTQQNSQSIKQYGGTGLGLSISKKLADLMNGTIAVSSEVGIGSNFTLELNEVYTSSILLEEKSCENRINEAIFKRAKVLVVDDIELNIELVKGFFLKNKNMVFDDALSGEEAVEKVKTNDYDLIIMDIAMGIMDGLEASKIIKSIKNIPIIILTASLHKKETIEHVDFYDSFLSKPILKSTLLQEMAKYLQTEQNQEKLDTYLPSLRISNSEKEEIKIFIEEINNCIAKGDMNCANEVLKNFKLHSEEKKTTIILDFINKLEVGVDGFDLLYIQEVLKDMKKNLDE